ncbi:zinc finger CCCH domain-containing protein 44-like isoform X2 [Gossypium arboreum]|uniref:zinc finger CCCH domain-containing protein 44-like isoform X2 n=1 Tax=Gossypium arboreum TaxID=29729 RepID=UPI0008193848|nr:zinc finger CCCH domain-containing protein 44-like isoform X2 [Gossypium arboreum]
MDNSQLVGNADVVVPGAAGATAEAGNGVTVVEMSAGKRRRGRPPRNQVRTPSSSAPPPPPQRKDEDDEEDVCFICFDGGSLVLCDRRGCPKAYHPACIKRDEAFFKSKAKWNCGWHICSTCQKASYYMCYTCTYSLCKNCTKDADYVNVRGNKGFCGTCMRTIMLIENIASDNKEMVQVDFDDKTSWEYLFKVYWVLLKEKLALSLDELTNAKNPWKETAIMGPKGNSSGELNNYSNAKGTNMEKSCGDQGDSYSKRRKTTRQQKLLNNVEYLGAENSGVMKGVPFPGGTNWATTELLEFVAHMKNGDVSVLSHFDVQALLLEYITRNNLRDPRQKSHIICDSRLVKLFGEERVGHFEMLKLLESHFLIQDHSRAIDTVRGEAIEAAAIQLAVDGNSDSQPIIASDKRRKTRKKVNEKGQRANPDEYAAVDVHNMNLIYLKRNWIENLIDDAEKIDGKVVGSFVRIKIPGNDQKQDFYRLVQVVGTSKAEPYKIGERTTDIMLEILNLDKKEAVSINGISNQEFTEDECQRLYQRIRCGLTKWFTVGEILEKAMALQAVRVNDWLQSEILRVTNLRDRASEKGHMKEYRECIEKLQLLNSPDERQRRLQEIPDIHCDPDMSQYCKSLKVAVELNKKKENNKPRDSGFTMKEKEPAFPLKGSDDLNDIGSRGTSLGPHSTGMELTVNNIETDKIWHYQDPHGKVQGPFHIEMLRRWSMSGHFPPDLRIWRANEKQDNSILLTDALDGWYGEAKQSFCNSCVPTEDIRVASDDGCLSGAVDGSGGTDLNVAQIESKQVEGTLNSTLNDTSSHYCGNNESVKSTELSSQSSPCSATCTPVVDVVNSDAVQKGSPLPTCDLVKGDNDLPGLPQVSSSLPSSTLSDKPCGTQSHQFNNDHGVERWDNGSINMGENMDKTSEGQNIAGSAKLDDSEGKSGRSSGQSWRSSPLNDASNGWDSNSGLISLARALEASEHNQDIDFSDIPTSTSKLNQEDSKGQANESKLSLSLNVPHRDSGPSWSTTSSLVGNSQIAEIVGEWGGHSSTPAKPSAKGWDSNLVPESSFKPSIMGSDHAAAPTSGSDQLTHSSPPDPANNAFAWDPIVPEPNEGDESVSDLLAEVEAMESLNGLTSPTSIMRCDGELAQGSEPDCFSPVGRLSPAPDPGKSDSFSSTNDLQMPSQSTVTTEPFRISQSEVLDAQKSSGRHSSTSAEINENTRPRDVSVNQYKVGSNMQPPAPPVTTWGMDTIDTAWGSGPETTSTNCGAVHGNKNFSWRGLGEGNTNVSRGTGQGTFQENSSINAGTSGENLAHWGSQQRYVSPRHRDFQGRDSSSVGGSDFHGRDSSSARGSDFQGKDSSSARGSDFQGRDSSSVRGSDFLGRDSSFARGRSSSNRHSSYYGGSNGGGTFRSPPKGQRICKFYESGYCKKGASCRYWHP